MTKVGAAVCALAVTAAWFLWPHNATPATPAGKPAVAMGTPIGAVPARSP